ncbi:hypothetical protein LAL4801_05727 [Roseibium aggregatum]|uniref:Uncharacterized protein n=1 Tax=Roseibium aggregatum TaxID=187304 RepID=A0A0M6YB09_9HYPH|nr:hypothetical protein LAL4801_05727 [Roseibium aggregatum]
MKSSVGVEFLAKFRGKLKFYSQETSYERTE